MSMQTWGVFLIQNWGIFWEKKTCDHLHDLGVLDGIYEKETYQSSERDQTMVCKWIVQQKSHISRGEQKNSLRF